MKTLLRILIILAAFTLVMGITYALVNAGSSSTSVSMPTFERGGQGRLQSEGIQPPFFDGDRPEFDGDSPRWGIVGLMFGFVKNTGIIAVIVVLISAVRKLTRRKAVPLQPA